MSLWPYPRILAHRGGGTLAPENTLGAIRLGAQMGFKGIEVDVMLAGCGTPVLIHDRTLKRTTGARGEVAHASYDELAHLDAGRWLGERWRGERLPYRSSTLSTSIVAFSSASAHSRAHTRPSWVQAARRTGPAVNPGRLSPRRRGSGPRGTSGRAKNSASLPKTSR